MTENVCKRLDNVPMVGAFVNQSENFKVVEIIEHDGKQAVDARELHQKLGNKRKFADWMKQRIEQYGFVESQDFEVFHNIVKNSNGGRPSDEYALSLDMAKELCMIENNEQGRLFRKYFIEVEKAARAKYEEEQLDKKASEAFDIKLKWLNFLPGYLTYFIHRGILFS